MKYGFFDDNCREYVITNPRTPWPWINSWKRHRKKVTLPDLSVMKRTRLLRRIILEYRSVFTLIGIWMFAMRRMSGGAGAGGAKSVQRRQKQSSGIRKRRQD